MTHKCAFGCETDDLYARIHLPTGETYHYCEDHAPEIDGETWGGPDA